MSSLAQGPSLAERPTAARGAPLWAGAPLDDAAFAVVRRRMMLDACKWDAQVGDVATLARFPLLIGRGTWRELEAMAERLTAETLAAEREILGRPDLLDRLGLPRRIRRVLRRAGELGCSPAAVRVMRFDFHPTADGWRISEVNSDVPGGFTEASALTRMMAERFPGCQPTGDPIDRWSRAVAEAAGEGGVIALLSAPGFMEDHQVIVYMAQHLEARGCRTFLAGPRQIVWRDGVAHLAGPCYKGAIDVVVRFYQGEWLARLPGGCEWARFFVGALTPAANPGIALVSESKRLALLWDELRSPMETWRRLLPETRDPRQVHWAADDGWVLKAAYCNNGNALGAAGWPDPRRWKAIARAVRWRPGRWVAQRRFETMAVQTPLGPMYPCVGVYTVDGQAAGAYARVSARPIIDFEAVDVALLFCADEGGDDAA